jgi:hypothetical protein
MICLKADAYYRLPNGNRVSAKYDAPGGACSHPYAGWTLWQYPCTPPPEGAVPSRIYHVDRDGGIVEKSGPTGWTVQDLTRIEPP